MKGSPARAGTPAPQCGTGVLARQISENGLKKLQTGGLAMFKQLPPGCLLGKAFGFQLPKVE
jgi:hypothetical protein